MSILAPIVSGAKTQFEVYVDQLSLVELGALFEILDLPYGHNHKLGMGKALGLGSVKISIASTDIFTSKDRYAHLEDRCQQVLGGEEGRASLQTDLLERAKKAFRDWLLLAVKAKGQVANSYEEIPHVKAFLRMTDYANRPADDKTVHMGLTEFQAARVLPDALKVQ